jgi:hypothetical protein
MQKKEPQMLQPTEILNVFEQLGISKPEDRVRFLRLANGLNPAPFQDTPEQTRPPLEVKFGGPPDDAALPV